MSRKNSKNRWPVSRFVRCCGTEQYKATVARLAAMPKGPSRQLACHHALDESVLTEPALLRRPGARLYKRGCTRRYYHQRTYKERVGAQATCRTHPRPQRPPSLRTPTLPPINSSGVLAVVPCDVQAAEHWVLHRRPFAFATHKQEQSPSLSRSKITPRPTASMMRFCAVSAPTAHRTAPSRAVTEVIEPPPRRRRICGARDLRTHVGRAP